MYLCVCLCVCACVCVASMCESVRVCVWLVIKAGQCGRTCGVWGWVLVSAWLWGGGGVWRMVRTYFGSSQFGSSSRGIRRGAAVVAAAFARAGMQPSSSERQPISQQPHAEFDASRRAKQKSERMKMRENKKRMKAAKKEEKKAKRMMEIEANRKRIAKLTVVAEVNPGDVLCTLRVKLSRSLRYLHDKIWAVLQPVGGINKRGFRPRRSMTIAGGTSAVRDRAAPVACLRMLSQQHLCHPQSLSLFSVGTHACKGNGDIVLYYGSKGVVPDLTHITVEEHGFLCAADGFNQVLVEFVPRTPSVTDDVPGAGSSAGRAADGEPGAGIAADSDYGEEPGAGTAADADVGGSEVQQLLHELQQPQEQHAQQQEQHAQPQVEDAFAALFARQALQTQPTHAPQAPQALQTQLQSQLDQRTAQQAQLAAGADDTDGSESAASAAAAAAGAAGSDRAAGAAAGAAGTAGSDSAAGAAGAAGSAGTAESDSAARAREARRAQPMAQRASAPDAQQALLTTHDAIQRARRAQLDQDAQQAQAQEVDEWTAWWQRKQAIRLERIRDRQRREREGRESRSPPYWTRHPYTGWWYPKWE